MAAKNSRTKKRKDPSTTINNHPEVLGLGLIAISFLTFLSLFSFSHGHHELNYLGLLGYVLSFCLQYLFGLTSYLFVGAVGWLGWKMLCRQPVHYHPIKFVYIGIMLISLCMLLTVVAETKPKTAKRFSKHIYTEALIIKKPIPQKLNRYYLGGRPAYYFYQDIDIFSLKHILSNVGVTLIFTTIFLSSFLLFTQLSVNSLLHLIYKYVLHRGPPKKKKLWNYLKQFYFILKNMIVNKKTQQHATTFESEVLLELPVIQPQRPRIKEHLPQLTAPEPERLPAATKNVPATNPLIKTLEDMTPSPVNKRKAALKAQQIYNGDFKNYKLPDLSLLTDPKKINQPSLKRDLRRQAEILEETLISFGIEAKVGSINCGPTITSFEVHPAIGVKVQRIKALENDIALNMQAKSIRIIAPIPGKAAVGIEIPAQQPLEVNFKEMLSDYQEMGTPNRIPILLGKTVSGENVISDLSRMPHCIIAGATGTGKSVCINTFVISILMNCKPDEVKLLLIDPKKVELTSYSSLPHMLSPVITELQGVIAALNWLVREMERRYEILKRLGVRNIAAFNARKIDHEFEEAIEMDIPKHLFYIVCIIDELADLMMTSSNEIEMPIARIAQMARAVGIHLVLATQRPSREVITGLIKANFPTRISFKVASRVNSQIILDEIGAETLLGNGDMLFQPPGAATLLRTQGCFIHDKDIYEVIEHICEQAPPNYLIDSFDILGRQEASHAMDKKSNSDQDALYEQALELVQRGGSISTTFIQRKLKIGYARAASIMDQLEENGIISAPDGSKPRKLLIAPNYPASVEENFPFEE